MAKQTLLDFLGWTEEQIEDIRFVGYSYIKQGVYDIALDFFEGLVALNPLSLYDLQTLGALFLQTKRYEEALTTLNKALTIEPKHFLTKLNKLKTLYLMREIEKATPLAIELQGCEDRAVASEASALLLAHRK